MSASNLQALAGSTRILLVGIDSADIGFIEAHLDRLPHLRRFFASSVVRRLESPASVLSASVWPTFYTGAPPGEHGQYYPMQWDARQMRMRRVSSEWLACEPFWRPLARNGLRVTTLDVQTASPSRTADGIEIANWGSQSFSAFHVNQPGLAREIERRFGRHPMGADIPVDKSRRRLAATRKSLLDGTRRRGELARWLLTRSDWQLCVVVFPECHRGGHYLWPEPAASDSDATLLEIYRAVDHEVGTLLERSPLAATTIVFALHGMGPNESQMHFVAPVLDRINAAFAADRGAPPWRRRSGMRRLREWLPGPFQEAVAQAVPERVRDWVTSRAFGAGLEWRRTPGFALPTGSEGFVRVNLIGREAEGCLEPGSDRHRRYLELVRETFMALCVAGTGEALARAVVFPGELFPGPRSEALPDMAVLWNRLPPATAIDSPRFGRLTGRLGTGRGGNHRASGFAAIAGAGSVTARAAELHDILDLSRLVRDLALESMAASGR